ncbi:hypothetical protein PVIIG_05766 [Plasmodium vivax India VII]|uniref:Uncharacterized protein n=1 Tax=Plasmodium vivax India VII TaxID=1077284 RepID=A0A0J9S3T2_PLAVI|nr:hypothetical protein PVIIG_05766 [Plasmodium vivax India VII]
MPRTATDKSLLTYVKYLNLKERFNNKFTKNDGLDPEDLLNDIEFNISEKDILRPVLVELLRHLRNSGIFMNDEDKACSYISYILSKQVKGKVDEYKQETFDMFQKLVNAYNTSPKYRSTNCSTNLLYVHSEMYKKMNKLYVLYEEYKKLIKDNHLGETKSCSDVSLFLRQYNEFIRNNQPTDTHYKYILDEFEKEIKYRVGLYNEYACSGIKYHIEEIRLHTSSENERHKASDQVQQKLNHMEKQNFKKLVLNINQLVQNFKQLYNNNNNNKDFHKEKHLKENSQWIYH